MDERTRHVAYFLRFPVALLALVNAVAMIISAAIIGVALVIAAKTLRRP